MVNAKFMSSVTRNGDGRGAFMLDICQVASCC
jgi:hypothetical protein